MGALEFLASYSGAHLFGRAASQKLLEIGALFAAQHQRLSALRTVLDVTDDSMKILELSGPF